MRPTKQEIANSRGVEHLHITGEKPEIARQLVQHVKGSGVFNPIVSQAQNAAMHAAAAGHSTLGIPKSVGQDYVAAGPASTHLPKRKGK